MKNRTAFVEIIEIGRRRKEHLASCPELGPKWIDAGPTEELRRIRFNLKLYLGQDGSHFKQIRRSWGNIHWLYLGQFWYQI